jgi:hypothetical protein
MAGTVVTTELPHAEVQEVKFAWTSAGTGAADATTTQAYSGQVVECVIIPGAAADIPDNLFDVVVTDANSVDVLHGLGADLSNADTTVIAAGAGFVCNTALTLAVTNAGATNTGTVILHILA